MIKIFKTKYPFISDGRAFSGKAIVLSDMVTDSYQNIMLYYSGGRRYSIGRKEQRFIDAERPDGTLST